MQSIEPYSLSSQISSKLSSLLTECGLEPEIVADALNISYDRMLQLLNPEAGEQVDMDLTPLADLFCISLEELQGKASTHSDRIPGTYQPNYLKIYSVPLLHWEFDVDEYLQLEKVTKKELPQVATHIKVSEKAFALIVEDCVISLRFPKGTILIFDPMIKPRNQDFILTVHHETKKLMVKRFSVNEMNSEIMIEEINHGRKEFNEHRVIATFIQAKHQVNVL